MTGTTMPNSPATSYNLWTGSLAIWLWVIILRHGGTASLRPVCLRTGTAYTSQVLYGPNLLRNNFRGFLLSFRGPIANLSRTHVKTVLYKMPTQGPLDQCSYIYIFFCLYIPTNCLPAFSQ